MKTIGYSFILLQVEINRKFPGDTGYNLVESLSKDRY